MSTTISGRFGDGERGSSRTGFVGSCTSLTAQADEFEVSMEDENAGEGVSYAEAGY